MAGDMMAFIVADPEVRERTYAFMERLRWKRLQRHIYVKTLAAQLGIWSPQLTLYEGGKRIPSHVRLQQWAALLDEPVPFGVAGWKHAECGTYAGWHRHDRKYEDKCDPCKAAYRKYRDAQDVRRLLQRWEARERKLANKRGAV
jgi:transcriptional regulator with XRE-family HTH domain